MEDKFQRRASLGSKLPKFGTSKPVGSFLQQAQNGTCNGISAKGNFSVEKHIEHDRTSALPLNWSKSRYPQNDQISRAPPNFAIEKTSQVMVQNDAHRPGVPKPGKQSNMLVSHKEDLSDNVLSSSTKFTKGTQFGKTSYPGSSGHKPLSNGFYTVKPPIGLYRPRANSATGRNFTTNVFTSDNKPFSHVRRSQSFSHSIQNSKYPATGLTRSYSLHRETDMTKIHQSQHLPTRPDLQSRTAKLYGLSNGNEPHMKSMFTRTGYSTGLTSGLKKPVFTNGPVASAPLGYKLTRPSLQKANRPPYPREIIADGTKGSSVALVNHKIELVSNGTCQATDPLHKGEEQDLDIDHFSSCKNLERQDFRDSYFSEDVDELSISSLSSSDKNDFSEDFSDDFLDLEDVNNTIIEEKPEKTFPEKPTQHSLAEPDEKQKISNNIDDWLDMNMSAKNEADTKSHSYVENGISPDMEYRDPSSLELSPSDSSGGTYMWDEEGMEPIGNVHRCESYESSEMNSMDILNNIETCDLEEDDLMLDVEIPEDPPCDPGEGENMSRFERSDRNLRQQKLFWKRNPPRLNGQEQYHLSNPEHYHNGRGSSCLESPYDQKDSFGSPYCSPLSPRSPQAIVLQENTVMLDEMTLRHMVQDCTTVKTQLLKLKRLLQQADDLESPVQDLQLCIPATIEQTETETHLKTENLLTEIQQLKEESRKKDDMIKQLQEQLKTRCKCQKETQEPTVEKLKQHDKFTQTNWRKSSPQILQCSSSTLSSTDHPSGKLTVCQPTGVPNEPAEHIQQCLSFYQSDDSGASSIIPASELSDLLSTQLKINDGESNPKNRKEKHDKGHAQFDENKNVRLCSDDLVPQSLPSQQKYLKSKTSVNASLPGHISGPKTLQCPKPKLQYTLAYRGNTLAPPNSSLTSTDFKMLMYSSGPSLQQENFHTKKKQTIPNTYPVHQTTVNVSPDSNTCKLEKTCSPAGQSLLTKTMPDARYLIHSTSLSTDKLSSEGELSTHLRAPATEPSKPVSKLMPKGSLLRPTSHLPSKLKTPNISKPDVLSKDVPKEAQKPPGKASPVVPRHLSHKKDGMRESDTCSIPKRQSRLPQPKSH
ncbi:PREDICTED: serine-rich coiled-coil domain-containing protein 2 [Nanorana parkeri]|uniref:serine-rich coiled-coil domain-containing protein 2 n=1 Tax=Nanorana parkeri TaxID=125878 RepID=UPI0008544325|nr:PREDICTED: serine-rich coiled-coil domain-containing protein 2 [Nanorana parkeri]